jgi:parallel beta-helix repeat protein
MLEALDIVLMLLMPTLMLVTSAYSPSYVWAIPVQTDRPYYTVGDKVQIDGTVTYGGQPRQSIGVAIVVKLSSSSIPYYTCTATTDSNGEFNASVGLGGPDARLGEYIVNSTASTPDHMPCTNQTAFQLIDRIYIKASGDVEPASAPISRSGDTYTLTDNITGNFADAIVVERNDIILDGAGFTLNETNFDSSNGIYLKGVGSVTVENVSINSFHDGIYEEGCSNCHIVETNMSSNGYGIHYQQSNFNTIEGNSITRNTYGGILLDSGSDNNTISKNRLANTISSNHIGAISLRGLSNNNGIFDNNFVNNTWYGIYVEDSYSNNIFHNNFVNNTFQAFVDPDSPHNVWDDGYPSGGNYWSNYLTRYPNAAEIDASGIWNTAYVIDTSNRDNYPLMNSWNATETSIAVNGTEYPVTITTTNSTITKVDATPSTLNFTVTGTPGTKGSMLIIVQKGLNTTQLQVFINGNLTTPPPVISDNATHYFIYCELSFSTLRITIPFVVPVVPVGTLAATILMISALGVYVKLRRKKITA